MKLTLAVGEYNFMSKIVVQRPTVHLVQFCIPGVDISSWDNNIRIVSIVKHQISGSNSGKVCCIDYIRCWANSRSLHYASCDVKLSGHGAAELCTVTAVGKEVDEPIVDFVGYIGGSHFVEQNAERSQRPY